MILVVGAGPTGLTVACELARRGVECRVIEKAPRLFIGSRAKGLQPRTLEVFEDIGILPAIFEAGMQFPPFKLYSGSTVVWEKSLEQMMGVAPTQKVDAIPYPRPWLIPQWRTDQILHDRFVELGGRVELETELTALTTDGVATLRSGEIIKADYVVGADGGRSTVRKLAGFSFLGETNTHEQTLIGDVRATGLEGVACHILTHAGDITQRFSLWNLPGSDHYQFVATVSEAADLTLEGVQALLESRTGRTDIRLSDLRWISLHRIHTRMVDRMQIGRILLAGDAAHVHSSAGGQGLNTGVQDAYNLGWKLAAAVKGNPDILATYDEERLPIAAHVLGLTDQLHRQNFRAGNVPAIHQLDIGYRGSSLCLDQVGAPLQAGDRAPDGYLSNGQRLFDIFRGTHWTLLSFGVEPRSMRGVVAVSIASPVEGYELPADTFVLVRPDGYIAAVTSSREALVTHRNRFRAFDS